MRSYAGLQKKLRFPSTTIAVNLAHLWVHFGARFSANAAMPSFWSSCAAGRGTETCKCAAMGIVETKCKRQQTKTQSYRVNGNSGPQTVSPARLVRGQSLKVSSRRWLLWVTRGVCIPALKCSRVPQTPQQRLGLDFAIK